MPVVDVEAGGWQQGRISAYPTAKHFFRFRGAALGAVIADRLRRCANQGIQWLWKMAQLVFSQNALFTRASHIRLLTFAS